MKHLKKFNENIFHTSNTKIYLCLVDLLDLGFTITSLSDNKENKISIDLIKVQKIKFTDIKTQDIHKEIGLYPGNIHKTIYLDDSIEDKPAIRAKIAITDKENELIDICDDTTSKILHTFYYKMGYFTITNYFTNNRNNEYVLDAVSVSTNIHISIIN